MPDTLEQTPTPSVPVTEGPRDADRAALYEKHYGGTPPAPTEATPEVESTANVDQTQIPVAPPVAQIPPEVLQLLQSMRDELAEVKSKVNTPAAPPPSDVTPTEPSWVSLLREGKIEEAENAPRPANTPWSPRASSIRSN